MDLMSDVLNITLAEPSQTPRALANPQDPAIEYDAALYFLDGHYLFRRRQATGDRKSGKLVDKFVTQQDVAAAFSKIEQDSGWLPAGVVRVGSNANGPWYVYSAPSQKVTIQVTGGDLLTIPIPRTVLLQTGGGAYLWALKSKHFDSLANAFRAPFPNVHPEGAICWGNNTRPKQGATFARDTWALFFSSAFNNDLAGGKSAEHKDNVLDGLRKLAEVKANKYPHDDLVPVKQAIGAAIDSIIKRGN